MEKKNEDRKKGTRTEKKNEDSKKGKWTCGSVDQVEICKKLAGAGVCQQDVWQSNTSGYRYACSRDRGMRVGIWTSDKLFRM